MSLVIRTATAEDESGIQTVHLDAFDASERDAVAALAIELLSEASAPKIRNFVAELDGGIVGHVAFSPAWNGASDHLLGYVLAPLAVSPSCQGKAIGTKLVQHGIEALKQEQIPAVFVYGDPKYYGRLGFSVDLAAQYTAPYPLQYPQGWQAMCLSTNHTAPLACKIKCVAALDDEALW